MMPNGSTGRWTRQDSKAPHPPVPSGKCARGDRIQVPLLPGGAGTGRQWHLHVRVPLAARSGCSLMLERLVGGDYARDKVP